MILSTNRVGSTYKAGFGSLLLGGLGLAYPFLVYAVMGRVPAGALVLVALALVGLRFGVLSGSDLGRVLLPAVGGVAVATALLALADAATAALAYPVLMSLGMAAAFGLSLRRGPPLVQILAGEAEPEAAALAYMRKVTWVWCLFLLGNALVSGATAVRGDLALWTLYNGLVSYVLMGVLFAAEYGVRRWVKSRR